MSMLTPASRRARRLISFGIVTLLATTQPAFADFSLNYIGGTYTFGDSAHVGDGVRGSLTFSGAPELNQTYAAGSLVSWSLATIGTGGFRLSSATGNVLTAFSLVLDGSGAVSYYNFAAEQHVATCDFFCDPGQKAIVVTKNGGQFDAAQIQDPNAFSGTDAAYFDPGRWSAVSAVPESSQVMLLIGGLLALAIFKRRQVAAMRLC